MSYQVLARKYRPRNFEEMVGQEHVVQALSNALAQQRLHHAYLFTGTRGVGKTTVSRVLAKSLNCETGITSRPCGQCPVCRDIDAGRFVDYVELDAASNRGVDEIAPLLEQAIYKPVVGRFKVYMIDEVHMLTNTAFNAMLKTLEEPPEYLKFVLATTDPQKVPVTVLSRCLQFNLRPMAPETVQQHLRHVLEREAIAHDEGALRLLGRAARGSMRDALSLTDQAIAYGSGVLAEAGVRDMLGVVDRSQARRAIQALGAGDGRGLLAVVEELRGLGLSAQGLLDELAMTLQQMAILQVVPDAPAMPELAPEEALACAQALGPAETQLCYSMAVQGRQELPLAPDEYAGLTMVLLRMLAFRPAQGKLKTQPLLQNAVARLTVASPMASPAPSAPMASPASMPASAPAALTEAQQPAASPRPAPVSSAAIAGGSQGGEVSPSVSTSEAPAAIRSSAGPDPLALAPVVAAVPAPKQAPQPVVMPRHEAASASPLSPVKAAAPPSQDDDLPPWLDAPMQDEDVPLMADDPVSPPDWADERAPSTSSGLPQAEPMSERSEPVPAAPSTASVAQFTAEGERWWQVVQQLQSKELIAALVAQLAMQSQWLGEEIDEGGQPVWLLRVERATLRTDAHADKLTAALAQVLPSPVRLRLEAGPVTDSPYLRDQAARQARQEAAEQFIQSHPLVRELQAALPAARIVPGSVIPL